MFPGKVLADQEGGGLIVSDTGHNRIVVAGLDGTVRQVIGSGRAGFDDGPADTATFYQPQGCALAGDTLYVADTENHVIRRVDLRTGVITTVLGTGTRGDGPEPDPRAYRLSRPHGVFAAGSVVYVSDSEAHRIRVLTIR
jgi:DNA-binding beta-propeller fold protein YncE